MKNPSDTSNVAGELARDIVDAAGAPPLIGDLAAGAVRLAIAVIGRDGVQAILNAEYSAAKALADAAADAVEKQRFGSATENTTAPASPQALKKGG
jgi:hypothetical protein